MRILFSTDQVHLHGGIEKVMAEKASYFADVLGYEVTILTTEQRGKPACYPLSDKIRLHDIGVNYDRQKSYFDVSNLKKIFSHFSRLNKAIGTIKPDVIISCNYAFDFYWLPFVFTKIPKIKEFHSSRFYEEKVRNATTSTLKKLKYKWDDFIESRYTKLLLLNPDEKAFYRSNNLAVIPNPNPASAETATLVSKIAIAAGRISPVKGFDHLIQAWAIVVKDFPDWRLEIYGEDYLGTKAQLSDLVSELKMEQNVRFAGVSNAMQKNMAAASLYLMSSQTECFPMVLLEALAVGLPIVSYDCPTGPRHIVTNFEDGLLAADQDIADLAQKILLLLADSKKRTEFGQKAKINSRRFETSAVMNQWQQLLVALKK